MSKQSGLKQGLYVDGYNISGDIQSLGIGGGCAVLEMTGIDKEAFERQGGLRDGHLDAVSYFNPGTDNSHQLLRPISLTDKIVTFVHLQSGDAASLVAKRGNYDPTRAADGMLTAQVNSMANGYGLEWGNLLTGLTGPTTQTGAAAVASVDFAASSAFGLQAYLQVFSFTGTSCTVKLQESSDDAATDAYADVVGGGFVAATARGAQRIETARNLAVERWLRVITTGTFSECTFAVMVCKNKTEVVF